MRRKSAFIFMFLLLVYACRSGSDMHEGKSVFRYNESAGISSLDPAFSKDQAGIWPCLQLFNGLVQLDSDLKVKAGIAKSWEISDSARTYMFHLRSDVYFHENELFKTGLESEMAKTRKVTASDFVYSLNRLTDPLVASPGAWVMNAVEKDGAGKLTGISAVNDSTLQIRLHHPFPAFLSLLAMPYCSVVPYEIVEHYKQDFRKHPVGTGPFKFSVWKEGVSLIFLRNENYFESTADEPIPFLDAVQISFINDKQSAFIEFLKGNLDFISGLDASYKDELLTRDGQLQERHLNRFRIETLPYLNTEYLGILIKKTISSAKPDPLQERKVRQALSMGFDKSRMMTFLRNNMGTPGTGGFIPPGMPFLDSVPYYGYTYNPAMASRLLAEAGFTDDKTLPEIVLSTTSTYLDLCEYIKSEWESLGFKIRIDVNQAAIHRKMVAEQKLDFFRGSWIADYPDAENYLSLFYSENAAPSGPNYTHYRNAAFDDLYKKSFLETNDSLRSLLYSEMDRIVMQDAPVIILYYDKVIRLTQHTIFNLENNAMNLLILKRVKKTKV